MVEAKVKDSHLSDWGKREEKFCFLSVERRNKGPRIVSLSTLRERKKKKKRTRASTLEREEERAPVSQFGGRGKKKHHSDRRNNHSYPLRGEGRARPASTRPWVEGVGGKCYRKEGNRFYIKNKKKRGGKGPLTPLYGGKKLPIFVEKGDEGGVLFFGGECKPFSSLGRRREDPFLCEERIENHQHK